MEGLEIIRDDDSGPFYINERFQIGLAMTAPGDPDNPTTEPVPVVVTFVDAERPDDSSLGCSSNGVVVNVVQDGLLHIYKTFVWPVTRCTSLIGRKAVLKVEVDPAGTLAARTVFSEELDLMEAEPDEGGEPMIDIDYASLQADSSVMIFPRGVLFDVDGVPSAPESPRPALKVNSVFVVGGRDPYVAPVDTDALPEELRESAPGIEEDLRFGKGAAAEEIDDLPGDLTVTYEITSASDGDLWLPLTIGTETGARVPEVTVSELQPGIANALAHDLYLEGETLEQIIEVDGWLGQDRFLVRGCFTADFEQFRPVEGAGGKCRILDVVLVADTSSAESGAGSISFDRDIAYSIGNSRVGLEAAFGTANTLNETGAFSDTELRLSLQGNIGAAFSLDLFRSYATMDAPLVGDRSFDAGMELFGVDVMSETIDGVSVDFDEDLTISKSQRLVTARFAFGPVMVVFDLDGGGQVGIAASGTLQALQAAACRDFMPIADEEDVARRAALAEEVAIYQAIIDNSSSPAVRAILEQLVLSVQRVIYDLDFGENFIKDCAVLSGEVGPFANLTASATGGIDIGIAMAGVQIDLNIAETRLPAYADLAAGINGVDQFVVYGRTGLNLEFTPLSGTLSLVGRIGFPFFAKHLSVPIVSFSTPTITTTLLSKEMAAAEVLGP